MYSFSHIPHKNVIASSLFAAIILGVGWWTTRTPSLYNPSDTKKQSGTLLAEDGRARDSDGDNLPDWQEALYGSNLEVADSDGDGTLDGAEVAAGRDPTRAGPDDNLYTLPQISTSTDGVFDEAELQFYAQFLKERGDIIREDAVRDLFKEVKPEEFSPRYSITDLKIVSGKDDALLRTYGNEFGKLVIKYTKKTHANETEILSEALKTKSEAKIAELELPAVDYLNFSRDLRAMSIPTGVAQDHLAIVNGYDIIGRSLMSLTSLFREPLRGDAAHQAYLRQIYLLTGAYGGVGAYFSDNKIIFTKDEEGYFWNMSDGNASSTVK